jgi:ERCC4-type nuclease
MLSYYKYTEKEKDELLKSIIILIDSREQSNKWITDYFDEKGIPYRTKKLDYGDYSYCIPKNDKLNIPRELFLNNEIAIERKGSLEELSGNFSNDRDRFEKELSLYKGKMHLLIEGSSYHDIYNNNYKTQYNKKSFMGSLHSFALRYDLSVMFMPNKGCSGVFVFCTCYYHLKSLLH